MRISDWSSDVCSSDLSRYEFRQRRLVFRERGAWDGVLRAGDGPASIAQGEADGLCPDIQSDQPPAGRQHGTEFVPCRSDQRARNVVSLSFASARTFAQKRL